MGKRVDNILIIEDFIFVIEFKVGDTEYQKHAIEQAVDYCLDLQNFHEGSHHEKLVPVLISTKAPRVENKFELIDNLFEPLKGKSRQYCRINNTNAFTKCWKQNKSCKMGIFYL